MEKKTIKFTLPSDEKENMKRTMRAVYESLSEKGYNPVNQIVGYLIDGVITPSIRSLAIF